MQVTSLLLWLERSKFACSSSNSWHERQRCVTSSPFAFSKTKILLLSPPPSTCALPGPWQASHPCHCGPFLVSVVLKWRVVSKFLKMSSWQVLQVSEPTYWDASADPPAGNAASGLACLLPHAAPTSTINGRMRRTELRMEQPNGALLIFRFLRSDQSTPSYLLRAVVTSFFLRSAT